jgi:hypothetical protein
MNLREVFSEIGAEDMEDYLLRTEGGGEAHAAFCRRKGCNHVEYDVEPDFSKGDCPICGAHGTVDSVLVVAGLI